MKTKHILRNSFLLLFVIALIVGGIISLQGYKMYQTALSETSVNEIADRIYHKPDFTPIEQLPPFYLEAVIAVEDQRFYDHKGVDYLAILRALWNDLRTLSFAEGGSTITQQVAKNLYFTQERTPTRKIAEILMAWKIESVLEKDEILELYVNSIYFGDGYYSISKASNGYYGKNPSDLNQSECTLLAGIPNAPSIYAPTVNPELTVKRQQKVLQQLVEQKKITKIEAEDILNEK